VHISFPRQVSLKLQHEYERHRGHLQFKASVLRIMEEISLRILGLSFARIPQRILYIAVIKGAYGYWITENFIGARKLF